MSYITHLQKDKKLATVIRHHEPFCLQPRKPVYLQLCNAIIGQQLSVKVAAVIKSRFLALYPSIPTPADIAQTPYEQLRSIGLSHAKANYVHNVAQFALINGMEQKQLSKMSDGEVIDYLTQIKGVGRWTVEMLLMFTLGREDVFSADDLGIQQAMQAIYQLPAMDKKARREKLEKIARKWRPYRTYACLHLWHWKDNPPHFN
ncbi:MAG: DNA-3-methyladenine glycosylase 2 family protein [Hydrotalea flava]|uniref:DNA-3-methyladenine glycosylase family protein n=1 Tax=Hydrotalea TaxID=1004300 RepID=UPI000942FD14|nr:MULTISPECIES: DNA-3-methyladenine glycosylase [Hydrotalea]MBY0346984.1 DNA-3-methyladenine glycosylase [Hydrotalea flava]NIM34712.1 DNA-3-methyladenine glycosylase 2 family protein [Hydrotalea flava]NIM37548.1 DNA-3-methyladenine glycosylase 2 family protein [Hydrotalea flava]NIN02708.1 DNA-3-methyladenine glycosylase 2 family protein [Hydrotalea flava]NIN14393.1 DNA-3-methyladenine glycosylase 2 family protein [Hydrotalea flava]